MLLFRFYQTFFRVVFTKLQIELAKGDTTKNNHVFCRESEFDKLSSSHVILTCYANNRIFLKFGRLLLCKNLARERVIVN